MKNKFRSYIELSSQAFSYNIDQIKNAIGSTQLAVVVKSNAYGHGIVEIAQLCENNSVVEWLCTAGLHEALILRNAGIKKPIMALSYLDDDLELAVVHNIHCAVYTQEIALELNKIAQKLNKEANIHIKIDTGMSRMGIKPEGALEFIQFLQKLPNIRIFGIFTHLCDTPNPDQSFSYLQLERFDNLLDQLKFNNIEIPCTHAQSSSALCIIPKRQYTLMRCGAFSYGIWKSDSHKNLVLKAHPSFDLQPVMTWKTHIIQIKELQTGSFVGYDRTFCTSRDSKIAILPIGYYDGLPRGLSNRGHVLINGQLAPIVGIVSMNLTAIDVTDITKVNLFDEVTLLGNRFEISANQIAAKANIITNVLTTNINSNVPKIVVDNSLSLPVSKPEEIINL